MNELDEVATWLEGRAKDLEERLLPVAGPTARPLEEDPGGPVVTPYGARFNEHLRRLRLVNAELCELHARLGL